ncbi:cold-shock protein [Brevibacillus brevis]|uniref:Cold-shock protein n=1 Tax=Brevibacillus brevis TaxID=1393 RepID=A0ABY9T2B2_BREBE|nr:cold-shock protein [Brevibacillus brevis]WNC14242.1 cold-shock protein [Brevibacillus brevis]
MYFSKKAVVPVEEEETDVWMCTSDSCTCWMRDNFSFDNSPNCPFCHSPMVKETKVLPVLTNHSKRHS